MIKRFLFLLFIVLTTFVTHAETKVSSIIDTCKIHLPIDKIVSYDFNRATTEGLINLKNTTNALWIKVELEDSDKKNQLFQINNANLNLVDLYYKSDQNEWVKIAGGSFFPFNEREYKTNGFIFNFNDYPSNTFYFQIKTKVNLLVPYSFHTPKSILEEDGYNTYLDGIYLGIGLLALFSNIFLFFSLRDRIYLHYCLFLIVMVILISFTNGAAYRLFPDYSFLSHHLGIVYVFTIFSFTFLVDLLGIHKKSKVLFYIVMTPPIIRILITPLYYTQDYIVLYGNLTQVLDITNAYILFGACIHEYLKGNKLAIYPVYGMLGLFLGVAAYIFSRAGFFPINLLTNYSLHIGSAFEILMFSIAISARIKKLQFDKNAATEKLVHELQDKDKFQKEYNEDLEDKVNERTKELFQQKEALILQYEELEKHQEEILAQRDNIEKQSNQLSLKNQQLVSGIRYAKRLQDALLPHNKDIAANFSDYFVIYKPKFHVSGDFYWLQEVEKTIYFAVFDCTGQGVPGAIVSIVGNNALNRALFDYRLRDTDEILNRINNIINVELNNHAEVEVYDGMDISLVAYNKERNTVQFSGAYSSIYHVRSERLEIYKGDRQSIGAHFGVTTETFSKHEFLVQEGDCIYLFTDGFSDQFGGSDQRKYTNRRFSNLIKEVSSFSNMNAQKEYITNEYEAWRSKEEQVDDILIVGLKI